MSSGKLRVGWISTEALDKTARGWTSQRASLRYRMAIPCAALEQLGCDSHVLHLNPSKNRQAIVSRLQGTHAVVIGKVMIPGEQLAQEGPALLQFVADLGKRGIKVLADFSDYSLEFPARGPLDRSLANIVDAVVTSTPPLAELFRGVTHVPVFTVTDPVEGRRGEPRALSAAAPVKVLWFGHWTNFSTLRAGWAQLEPLAREGRIAMTVISTRGAEQEGRVADVNARWRESGSSCRFKAWSVSAVFEALQECDAVVIPSDPNDPQKLVKSPNRFAESLWAGRFVIAHPLPAYQPFSAGGWIGDDLAQGVRWLLDNPGEALQRIRAGQDLVAAAHAPAVVGQSWKSVIEAALSPAR